MSKQSQLAANRPGPSPKRSVTVTLADSFTEIQEAQRLRYAIFAREMGARLHTTIPGFDRDPFDTHCYHLLVRDSTTGEVIGCTRILTQNRASQAGGFYSQQEFAIDNVLALPGRFMEIGRTCVHRDYRSGATITALWSGLARFVNQHGFDYLIGCASVPLGEDGDVARAIYRDLSRRHLVSETLRVTPLTPLPERGQITSSPLSLPPLLKAYLRVGAKICGQPCLDSDFNVADLFILMPTKNLDRRYARHFMERS